MNSYPHKLHGAHLVFYKLFHPSFLEMIFSFNSKPPKLMTSGAELKDHSPPDISTTKNLIRGIYS
jgi:hypothetical protein